MAMPAARIDWTVEMLDALPDDGQRYEVIDGELFVTPAPSDLHQYVALTLAVRLFNYLEGAGVGFPVASPSDVRRADTRRNRLQPDVFVLRLSNGKRPAYPFELGDLLLVVEVESPSSSRDDHQTKRELYLTAGVPEYWVVSPTARTICQWVGRDEPGTILSQRLTWHPRGMAAPFELDLPTFFAEALGD